MPFHSGAIVIHLRYYGVPDDLVEKALGYLDGALLEIYNEFNSIK